MYLIKPLFMCKMQRYKSIFTYNTDIGETIWAAVQAWLIDGIDGSAVLVDTGVPTGFIKTSAQHKVEQIATLQELLKHHGYSVSDIKIIIMTQLHYDHAGFLPLFKDAKVYVQSKELKAAYNPHPLQKNTYNIAFLAGINFVYCNDEQEIRPGIKVFDVPGHSGGTQAVEISTEIGKVVISGLCTINENFYPLDKKTEIIIPGINLNAIEAYESMLRIKKRADYIIPMHDVEQASKESIP